ncbi:hypothetical protein BDZ90DRAFT_250187 [Jaminaea rosea]|uniref:Peptidase M50B-like-domain-containing protein n=1 Tax=Jaminaea rosea TaxID=1569628 RepID=A0A316UUF9_9BASI|nr:hypothetical protein BDZ90DRAFT_250187 [Jaminaea rosea]PWN28940.1 hypothetical protein BDZ90DRAFT_250187 [Jaminaea rosea]
MPSLWPLPFLGRSVESGYDPVLAAEFDGPSSSPSSYLHTLTRRASRIDPTADQRTIIIVACVYAVVIAILWHFPILKYSLYGFKLLTVGMHEFSHAFVGLITGAKIESIKLEPNEGGATRMRGGVAWLTLPAGYLGSSFLGAAMIACSFDIRASKVMSIVLGVIFLMTAFWARRDWLTLLVLFITAGILVAFWFIAHGVALQFFVLFVGVMSCLYSVWDVAEDLVFRKVEESDASAFSRLVGGPPQLWGVFWLFISVVFFAAGLVIGIVAFKEPLKQQQSEDFLNTRRGLRDDFVVLRPR